MATSTGQRSYEYCKFEVVSLNSYIYSYFDGWPGGMSCVGYEDTNKRHGRLLKRSTICLQSHKLHNIYNMYCFVTVTYYICLHVLFRVFLSFFWT